MSKSDTWLSKQRKMKLQYQLYDDFLQSTELTFDDRYKLIHEMGRLIHVIKYIDNLTLQEARKKSDDWPLIMTSIMN